MKMLSIKPTIYKFKTAEEFAAEFKIGVGDLVITNEYIYQPFFGKLNLGCDVLYQEKYGAGEPSDDMAEAMYKDIKGDHKRVIAIGGGTVIDISKLFALKTVSPILDLYDGKTEIVKDKELVLVPTTCGTAMDMILHGYKKIAADGPEARMPLLEDFLMASLYAGIAFGNAGCAAVHAMSYPLGATFHVAHGESNYAMFTGVMKNYMEIRQDGEIERLNQFIADILGCKVEDVYEELEKLLNNLIQKKALHEYGMSREQIEEFADSVIANQGRLMANNFVELDRDRLIKIYTELY